MTAGGWILMLASWVAIITTLVYCLSRVLSTHKTGNDEMPPLAGGDDTHR